MEHLTVEDLLGIAGVILDGPEIRDVGLLDSAAYRPQASAFGQEAYPTVHGRAAALLDAVVRSHALVDGNKRLGWAAAAADRIAARLRCRPGPVRRAAPGPGGRCGRAWAR
jgi:hypothetical protein